MLSEDKMLSAIRNTDFLGVRIRASATRSPVARSLRLAFLVDVSDSMSGDRLDAVKRTLEAARELFQAGDYVTLVTFGDSATTVLDSLSLAGEGLTQFYSAVAAITTNGCTNLGDGLETLLQLQQGSPIYDAVVVLTDGIINRGITSTVGLRTMALGLGAIPITSLGYGADHNRLLLRDMAIHSRGSYIYIDQESVLPTAIGDLLSGLRTEVLSNASVIVPRGWKCCELGGTEEMYRVGGIVPDRDYWVVFQRSGAGDVDPAPILLVSAPGFHEECTVIPNSDCHELQEQVLRARVAKALVETSDKLENGKAVPPAIAALSAEIDALSPAMLARPLVLRMKAQLAEVTAQLKTASPLPSNFLARMSSGGAYLGTQRGVSNQGDHTFSSPTQRVASNRVQTLGLTPGRS